MPDISSILPEIIAALTAGGWFYSARRRKQERESHEAEMKKANADLIAALRDSETKYTREILDTYNQQVVEPMRQQLERNTNAIARYQGAIDMAPSCRLYPDCVVVRKLQSAPDHHDPHPHGVESMDGHDDFDSCATS